MVRFLDFLAEEGLLPTAPTRRLRQRTSVPPAVYGKAQGVYPPRWLTKEEAYGLLLGACRDGTAVGLRDEVAIRLGLSGVRCKEIVRMTVGDYRKTGARQAFHWTGKGGKPRTITVGNEFAEALAEYLAIYESRTGQLTGSEPLIPRQNITSGRPIAWGMPFANNQGMERLVKHRASLAGLGHVSPHDLRRTAAGILHNAKDEHGAHYFDLLDIQNVLDHADPATTMKSYIEPISTETKDRAADFLD